MAVSPHSPDRLRILAALPLPYSEAGGFWNRDLGLIVRGLRAQGHDAWLVALKMPGGDPAPDSPVIVATREEIGDPAWWQRQAPDAIILNAWSAPRWHALRSAAASLGKPLVEKLDTDGVKSPHVWLLNFLQQNWSQFNLTDAWPARVVSVARGMAEAVVVSLVPAALYRRMVRSMTLVPVFAAETPVATARVRRFLRIHHASPMPRVITIPHPTNTDAMGHDPAIPKENLVIAVGRWKVFKKGWPLLFETSRRFLALHPDWKVVVIGDEPVLDAAAQREIDRFRGRLVIAGSLDHARLSAWYRRARIYLFPSYWETFNIAAAEALCCGCSVVGPSQLASVSYFAGFNSGTPSHVRSAAHLLDALDAEIDEWKNGRRDPAAISRQAINLFGVDSVARQFVELFREWPETTDTPTMNAPSAA